VKKEPNITYPFLYIITVILPHSLFPNSSFFTSLALWFYQWILFVHSIWVFTLCSSPTPRKSMNIMFVQPTTKWAWATT